MDYVLNALAEFLDANRNTCIIERSLSRFAYNYFISSPRPGTRPVTLILPLMMSPGVCMMPVMQSQPRQCLKG
jgi:hypothetical protein